MTHKNYEDTVADAILGVLSTSGDTDLEAAIGYLMQEPLDDRARALRDRLAVAAIRAVAQYQLLYTASRAHS